MQLQQQTITDWKQYVISQYPKEACAYIINDNLYTVTNASTTPNTDFAITVIDQLAARKFGTIQALLHSHPYTLEQSMHHQWNPAWPSGADMQAWIHDNIPWGISATDGEGLSEMIWMDDTDIPDLDGREFISGVYDCYTIVRDYYRINKGILLKNFPRGMDWWYTDQNLYEDNFRKAGFVEITESQAREGDVVLMAMFKNKISHAAVIVENDRIIHHLVKRLSGYDSLPKWRRQIMKYIRYVGETDAS